MPRVDFKGLRLRTNRFANLPKVVHGVLSGLLVLQFAVVSVRVFKPLAFFGEGNWPDGLLVVLATASTLASLARQLPGQNVLLVAFLIALIAGAAETLGALTGIPFGPYHYSDALGPRLFDALPWAVPLFWVVIILNARGVARLVMRPWRQAQNYGWWLMGLTVALVVLFDLGFEPFAVSVKGFWSWQPTRLPLDWHGAPVVNFLGWALTALLILLFVTPSLLNKRPVKYPPDFYPLIVWMLLNLVFVLAAAAHHLQAAMVFGIVQCLAICLLATRGALASEK
jgi:putative membrane protein